MQIRFVALMGMALAATAAGQSFYNYVGQLGPRSALIAWGVTGPEGNTIGRDSLPLKNAILRMAGRTIAADRNWLVVDSLEPDTAYPYEIDIDGQRRGGGVARTWQEKSQGFCFLVIGDYGNGTAGQLRVANAMAAEVRRRADAGCPVRFVLTVGDNIYADVNLRGSSIRSGAHDADWEKKFFRPYAEVLHQVPFLPTLGNHDGNGSEDREDLAVYLDNFFFPGNRPARWYTFTYGGMAQFFALDSTSNTEAGPPAPAWSPGGAQSKWLAEALAESTAEWKIPYLHHPVYNAGPRHGSSYEDLRHWVDLFAKNGVRVVFAGHEHNFQFTQAGETGGILYLVSGSGGELRTGDVRRNMAREHIAGWAASRLFLSVELDGGEARITPVSPDGLKLMDRDKRPVALPVRQSR